MKSVFPGLIFWFGVPFIESVKWGPLHIFNMHRTQTRKSSFVVFTYSPRDPFLFPWYVPRCSRKSASLRSAETT